MFLTRTYRKSMGNSRFYSFEIKENETDLWIAIDEKSFSPRIISHCKDTVISLRKQVEHYISWNKNFLKSYEPVKFDKNAPLIVKEMIQAGKNAGIGPMGAVAGAFSFFVAKSIEEQFNVQEIIIENGGDIYLKIKQPIVISVFAGNSPLSGKIGLKILPEFTPLGICTSSATVGPSVSFGKADAVTIACKNPMLADAYATSFCNKVNSESDIRLVLDKIASIDSILSIVIIIGDKTGIHGNLPVEFIKSDF